MGLILATVAVILLAANLFLTAILYVRLCLPDEEERLERKVNETMRRERRDPIDEGIDNIMRFEVGGKTGFEREYHDDDGGL